MADETENKNEEEVTEPAAEAAAPEAAAEEKAPEAAPAATEEKPAAPAAEGEKPAAAAEGDKPAAPAAQEEKKDDKPRTAADVLQELDPEGSAQVRDARLVEGGCWAADARPIRRRRRRRAILVRCSEQNQPVSK